MKHWSLIFLIIAVVAGLLAFTGTAGAATGYAKIAFFAFIAIWIAAFLVLRRHV